MQKNITVDVYVLCYNELKLSKFVLDYWNLFATNVYIYNNKSTDGCIELLKQENRFNIEIIDFDTNDKIDDKKYLKIKNNEWKKSKNVADFVVVSDFDEIIYSKNIMTELKFMKDNNYTICIPNTYQMFSKTIPKYNGQLLHNIIQTGYNDPTFGKIILFNPNKINNINYTPGAHSAKPNGEINIYINNNIFLLHFKNIEFNSLYEKHLIYSKRLSKYNLRFNCGKQYNDNYYKQLNDFNDGLNKSINIKNIIDNQTIL